MKMENINREKKRILCVEDDKDTYELLSMFLSEHTLVFAGDFNYGLFLARRRYFDLYILDNWLPGKSGIELCRRIREFDPHTPILFCSAAAYPADQQNGLNAGAQAYLRKPIELRELRLTVERLFTASQEMVIGAKRAELAALYDELHIHSLRKSRLDDARVKALRAKERRMRFIAKLAFLAAGGTRGDFARLWPAVYRDKIRPVGNEVEG